MNAGRGIVAVITIGVHLARSVRGRPGAPPIGR
jgi:hypothetical protein